MSADFWAGYVSGAAGILIGNPLDLLKVRLQAGSAASPSPAATSTVALPPSSYAAQFQSAGSLIRGASAPILGYGALNALLFMTYNRTSSLLTYGTLAPHIPDPGSSILSGPTLPTLTTTFLAGAVGGLATWVVSTPTELVKCRTQLSNSTSSLSIASDVLRKEGIRGLYFGGAVTALRDSVGYGFYFWAYELGTRMWGENQQLAKGGEAAKVLVCGGVAGVATWASIFPLDVVKTRVQTQIGTGVEELEPLVGEGNSGTRRRIGAVEMARKIYRTEGSSAFFKGLMVCSVRAFIVNAAQWAVYEWIMIQLEPGRKNGKS